MTLENTLTTANPTMPEPRKVTEAEWREATLNMLFDAYKTVGQFWTPWGPTNENELNLYTETKEEVRRFLARRIRDILPKDPEAN